MRLIPAAALAFTILASFASAAGTADREIIKPKALAPGDRIHLVAPARPYSEEAATSVTLGLTKLGFDVSKSDQLSTRNRYLAGTDEQRAAAVMEAFANPDIDAIICPVGGMGTTRFIDQLDYDVIAKNPKIITGFSDITGLHLAIYQKTGLVTFHAPTSWYVFTGQEDMRPHATKSYWTMLMGAPSGIGDGYRFEIPGVGNGLPVHTINGGVARGRLIGGNLSLVHALMGTPYEIDTAGHILFLEEIREAPYRVDRMLSTLRLAGKLDNVSGVVIGRFEKCEADEPADSFTVEELFDQYFKGRPYPVVRDFAIGHVIDNATIPIGVLAELDADAGKLFLLESPFSSKP